MTTKTPSQKLEEVNKTLRVTEFEQNKIDYITDNLLYNILPKIQRVKEDMLQKQVDNSNNTLDDIDDDTLIVLKNWIKIWKYKGVKYIDDLTKELLSRNVSIKEDKNKRVKSSLKHGK